MNNLQLTIAELKIEYAEQKLTNLETMLHPSFATEEELFEKILTSMERHGVHYHANYVRDNMGKEQRQRFFEQMSAFMHYDIDGASERQYMVNAKLLIYAI